MATTVYYRDVIMHDVLTRSWDEEVVYDASGADPLYTKIRMTFVGVLHGGPADDGTPYIRYQGISLNNVFTRLEGIRFSMMMPRGDFGLIINNRPLLAVGGQDELGRLAAPSSLLDVNNGPKPIEFSIEEVWGGEVFRVSWTVELYVQRFCGPVRPPVLNNRWSLVEAIDQNRYVTRTVRGELRIASYPAVSPAAYKPLIVPELESGFHRESIDYAVSPDGLICQYTVVDRQIEVAAPWPASEVEVSHTEGTQDGKTFLASIRVNLTGSPSAPIGALVTRAVQLFDDRLELSKQGADDYYVQSGSISVLHSKINQVTLDISIQRLPKDIEQLIANLPEVIAKPITTLPSIQGEPEKYDAKKSIPPDMYGTGPDGQPRSLAAASVLTVYLQRPCSDHSMPVGRRNSSKGGEKTKAEPAVNQGPYSLKKDGKYRGGIYDKDARKNIYMSMSMSDQWHDNDMIVTMPIADTASKNACFSIPLAKGYTTRTIEFTANRLGKWPDIPDLPEEYKEGDILGTRIGFARRAIPPQPTPDGQGMLFGMSMTATYVFNQRLTEEIKRHVCKLPILAKNKEVPADITFKDLLNKKLGP